MKLAALLIGLFVVAIGITGLAVPEVFVAAASFFQIPPVIYLAAVIRVVAGAVLVLAAPASRLPMGLRVLGGLIVIGGLLTPFVGAHLAQLILEWWSAGGPPLVRVWASAGLMVGAFIVYAVAPNRRAA